MAAVETNGGQSEHARVLDGKAISATIRQELTTRITALKDKYKRVPGLAVVIVGTRVDSQTYVRAKKKACEEVGIISFSSELPEDISQEDLLAVVRKYNSNPDVHGILVQLPLPKHLDEQVVLGAISVEKDVDGFHPLNVGLLAMKGRDPLFVPCTPLGCMVLLERSNIPIRGKRAVVVGRSNTVGMPAAMLLLKRDAVVTICHSAAQDMESIVREADIVIAAVGRTEMIKGSWIKKGATVIDVGINSKPDASKKAGYRLVGDVDYEECRTVAGAITPVPGGVGPMTIAMLLVNTVDSGERHLAGQVGTSGSRQGGDASSVSTAAGRSKPPLSLERRLDRCATVALGALVLSVAVKRAFGWVSRRFS